MTIVETLLLPARTPCMWDVSLRAHDSTTGRRGVCTTLQARATSPSTVSEFYLNGLVVSDVLCSSTLHSYEDPLWTSMHQHQALCSHTSMNVSPWQDRVLQQATFRSWCWALPTSSEFNLHCKVVVDCGHHAGYELQEYKECLPKCNKKESVSICDNYSQYQYMRIQSPERVLHWKQNPQACKHMQKLLSVSKNKLPGHVLE